MKFEEKEKNENLNVSLNARQKQQSGFEEGLKRNKITFDRNNLESVDYKVGDHVRCSDGDFGIISSLYEIQMKQWSDLSIYQNCWQDNETGIFVTDKVLHNQKMVLLKNLSKPLVVGNDNDGELWFISFIPSTFVWLDEHLL